MLNANDLGKMFLEVGNSLIRLASNNQTEERVLLEENEKVEEDRYVSREEVLQMYSPVLNNYRLNQAIHMGNLPVLKMGRKSFFVKKDIDEWLANNKNSNKGKNYESYKYV